MTLANLAPAPQQHPEPDLTSPMAYHCSRMYLLVLVALQMLAVTVLSTAISNAGLHYAAIAFILLTPVAMGVFFAKLSYRFELTAEALETRKPISPELRTITPLRNIQEVTTRAGILESLLGVGTVVIVTLRQRITWPHLADHLNVAENIRQRLTRRRD
ncbi:MAG: hypothetical protein RIC55_22805 [Pirellulaceae bacterium]